MTVLHFAAVLIFVVGLVHSALGERYILIRLFRRPDLPKLFGGVSFTIGTLRSAWHITTVAWWGIGAILWLAGSGGLTSASTLSVVGYTALASGLLPLIITRGRHLSWLAFIVIGAVALWYSAA